MAKDTASETRPILQHPVNGSPSPSTLYSYLELARLHRPIGSLLFFWPCAYGLLLALTNARATHQSLSQITYEIVGFAAGATLVRSAACVLSDICDKDFDALVERTKNRPLVTGRVSTYGAGLWAAALIAPVIIIAYVLPRMIQLSVLCGVIPLNIVYPFSKRWTWWPQLWLGFAINFGIFSAWFLVLPDMPSVDTVLPVITMFAGLICWTMVYDTIYACQDRSDDITAGVKSTALLFGKRVKLILSIFALASICCLVLAGILNGNGVPYFLLSCTGVALHFLWQLTTWDDADNDDCAAKFKANGNMGYIVFAGLLLDYIVKGNFL